MAGMRIALLCLCLGAGLLAATTACNEDEAVDCGCEEAGCFAPMCTKMAFVLAKPMSAKFGGVAAADQMCAQEAAAAGLPGLYYAWLSEADAGPRDRFSRSTVPYTLPDGTTLADDWAGLVGAGPAAPIDMTAAGGKVAGKDDDRVWTGTDRDGRASSYNNASNFCSGWSRNSINDSVVVGLLRKRAKAGDWTLGDLVPCTGDGWVYCVQQ